MLSMSTPISTCSRPSLSRSVAVTFAWTGFPGNLATLTKVSPSSYQSSQCWYIAVPGTHW